MISFLRYNPLPTFAVTRPASPDCEKVAPRFLSPVYYPEILARLEGGLGYRA